MRYTITFERTYGGRICYKIYGNDKCYTDPETGMTRSYNKHHFLTGYTSKDLKTAIRNAKDKIRKWMDKAGIATADLAIQGTIDETKNLPKKH